MSTVLRATGMSVEVVVASGPGRGSPARVVDAVSLEVDAGECVAVVGESGSGKSLFLRSLNGLLPRGATAVAGTVDLLQDGTLNRVDPAVARGSGLAMVFQEPMTALNPTRKVGALVAEGFRVHGGRSRSQARRDAIALLEDVGIPEPQRRAGYWPWQLSGGQRQRVMIAMALACDPAVLLCDEPTTALDVTVQRQILRLLDRLRRERRLAIVLVTHDLPVAAQHADRIAVMYAGHIVETGPAAALIAAPRHGYTASLLASAPAVDRPRGDLRGIPGRPPAPGTDPLPCRFADRCAWHQTTCDTPRELDTIAPGRTSRCARATEPTFATVGTG